MENFNDDKIIILSVKKENFNFDESYIFLIK